MPRNDNTLTVLRSGEASLDEQSRYDSVVQPPEVLYLELIKRALSFTLWPEPPMPVETFNYLRPAHIRWPLQLASSILKRTRLQLVRIPDATSTTSANAPSPGIQPEIPGTLAMPTVTETSPSVAN